VTVIGEVMTFKVEPHKWHSIKGIPWPVCKRCGLVRLKNEFTEWCIRHGCNNAEAPGYRSARKALTRRREK